MNPKNNGLRILVLNLAISGNNIFTGTNSNDVFLSTSNAVMDSNK